MPETQRPADLPGGIRGEVVFSHAFRPFFLLTAAYALLMLLAWASYLSGVMNWPDGLSPRIRHGHEMVFGFAGGAIAGFLLTAVAVWTNRPPVSGLPLIALCALWAMARLGGFLPGPFDWVVWGTSCVLFWGGLLALMANEIFSARNQRNYKALALLAAFLLTEATFFMAAGGDVDLQEGCLRTGILLLVGMIILIGGRIIPAFTQNWLRLNRPELIVQLPSFDLLDRGAVVVTAVFAIGFIFWPLSTATGVLALLAALAQGFRLWRWQGWLARREPLLWVLHLGFAWLPIGFLILGLSALVQPLWWESGIHAVTYGAAGTLILGVAARVSLGHTGRPLQASPLMTLAFGLITLGAICRVLAQPGHGSWMTLSVALWLGAYGLFLIQYVPVLLAPRVDSQV